MIAQIVLHGHAGFFDVGSGSLSSDADVAKDIELAAGKAFSIQPRSAPGDVCAQQTAAADHAALEKLGLAYTFRTMEAGLSSL